MVGGRYGDVKGRLRARLAAYVIPCGSCSMRVVYLVRKKDSEIYYGVHKMY